MFSTALNMHPRPPPASSGLRSPPENFSDVTSCVFVSALLRSDAHDVCGAGDGFALVLMGSEERGGDIGEGAHGL
eukprot:1461185-Rhodomonas_salina.3